MHMSARVHVHWIDERERETRVHVHWIEEREREREREREIALGR
jgi:hypothetical protein